MLLRVHKSKSKMFLINEPRANIIDIVVQANAENNSYYVKVIFKIINIPEDITLDLILNRVR